MKRLVLNRERFLRNSLEIKRNKLFSKFLLSNFDFNIFKTLKNAYFCVFKYRILSRKKNVALKKLGTWPLLRVTFMFLVYGIYTPSLSLFLFIYRFFFKSIKRSFLAYMTFFPAFINTLRLLVSSKGSHTPYVFTSSLHLTDLKNITI